VTSSAPAFAGFRFPREVISLAVRWSGLKRHRSARILAAGHAFVQNLRRGHYDIATETPGRCKPRAVLDELALAI